MEVLAHVAIEEAFHGGGHIFYQLCSLMDTGLRNGDWNCSSNCYSATISSPQMLWWQGAKLGLLVNTLLPLMFQHKGHVMWRCHLVPIMHRDTIQSVAKHWSMLEALFRICNLTITFCWNFNIDLDFKWRIPISMCAWAKPSPSVRIFQQCRGCRASIFWGLWHSIGVCRKKMAFGSYKQPKGNLSMHVVFVVHMNDDVVHCTYIGYPWWSLWVSQEVYVQWGDIIHFIFGVI